MRQFLHYFLLFFSLNIAFGSQAQNKIYVQTVDTVVSFKEFEFVVADKVKAREDIGFMTKIGDADSVFKTEFVIINTSRENTLYADFGDSNDEVVFFYHGKDSLFHYELVGQKIPLSRKEVKIGKTELVKIRNYPPDTLFCTVWIIHKSPYSLRFFENTKNSFKIYTSYTFDLYFSKSRLFTLFFFGAIFIMIFYNLVLAVNLKSRAYGYYVIYATLSFIFAMFADGVLEEYIFDASIFNYKKLQVLLAPLMVIAFLIFSRVYLQINEYLPRTNLFINLLILAWLFTYGIVLMGWWHTARSYMLVLALITIVSSLVWSLNSIKTGYQPARYYFTANVLLLVGGFFFSLYLLNIIEHTPSNTIIEYIPLSAMIFQMGISSLGLANRIKLMELEILNNQIKAEQEKQQLIEEKNQELEEKVRERTEELEIQKARIIAINEQLEEKVRERTKKLQKAYRDLLNLNYELDSFIYRAAHDIRGPITTIMGLTNLALLEKDFKKSQEYLNILDKFSKSTQVTLNRILSVNDIKNNHIKPTRFTLNELKDSVLALLIDNPNRHKCDIQFEKDGEVKVYYDFYLTQLILLNLIDNSLRYRSTQPNVKPYVHVKLLVNSEGLEITVTDNGQGIEDHIKDKIFDMFFRGNEYASGSGLGLYISRIAAKKLNGNVELVKSKDGITVFRAQLGQLKEKRSLYEPE